MKLGKKLLALALALVLLSPVIPANAAGNSIKIDQGVYGTLEYMDSMAEFTLSNMEVSEYFMLVLEVTASSDEPYEIMLIEYDDYGGINGEKYINSAYPDEGVTVNGRTLKYVSNINKYAIDTYHWVISVPEYQWFEGEDQPASNLTLSYTFELSTGTARNLPPVPADSQLFSDVSSGDWYYNCVKYAVDNGLFNGTSASTFSPNQTMTRGMFVTVLGRSAGVVESSYSGYSSFYDVHKNAYYAPYVNWAYEHDITGGSGNSAFSPDAPISRQDLVTILYRFQENPQDGNVRTLAEYNAFSDSQSVSSYAANAMRWAFTNGIINGVSDTRLDPLGTATRAQVAQIFMNADA